MDKESLQMPHIAYGATILMFFSMLADYGKATEINSVKLTGITTDYQAISATLYTREDARKDLQLLEQKMIGSKCNAGL